jgi:hypothetical protein
MTGLTVLIALGTSLALFSGCSYLPGFMRSIGRNISDQYKCSLAGKLLDCVNHGAYSHKTIVMVIGHYAGNAET